MKHRESTQSLSSFRIIDICVNYSVEGVLVERVVLLDCVAGESGIEVELGVVEVWESRVILALDVSDKGVTFNFVIEGLLEEVGPLLLKVVHGDVLGISFSVSIGGELVHDNLTIDVSLGQKVNDEGIEGGDFVVSNDLKVTLDYVKGVTERFVHAFRNTEGSTLAVFELADGSSNNFFELMNNVVNCVFVIDGGLNPLDSLVEPSVDLLNGGIDFIREGLNGN